MNLRPDPTFYPSPKIAMEAPAETLAFTLMLSPDGSQPDGLAVVNVDPASDSYGKIVASLLMPNKGDEFHHFGWNACSSALSPLTGHAFLERRYLIVPGIRSSRIYVIDVKDPLDPKMHKIIEPEEVFAKTGYSRPHTIHCGPEGIYVSTLGGGGEDGTDGPPGIFIMDCETFDILGRYEMDRGNQDKHYDFWWNLPRDYMVSSEWGLPPQFENGIVPEDLLSNKYGHTIHFWDLRARTVTKSIDLGENHQMALEIRPAHDPVKEYGFCGVVVDTTNLQGAIFTWWRDENGEWQAKKTITIDPQPADPDDLPELLKGFGAVPPLVTDIDLSLDDKYLYVACWGQGEMHQYDVSDPMNPVLAGKVEIGGIVKKTKHPNGKEFGYGPQMVEISRDGKRVYWTNSLYSTWDDQFYPGDRGAAMVMAKVGENGGLELDPDFWVEFPDGYRSHQIRLEGGDCSTDSFCYPSV
ncbi:MAG: selenium-binding protein SBP56-related protein [Rhodobacter sp.]|nr:selenium-binding protein SBP56-related protein [Rhodobacter sp.]